MNSALASLLADYSPPPEPASGIAILRKVKLDSKPEPELNHAPKPDPAEKQAELLREVEAKARQEERDLAQKRLDEAVAAERLRGEEELRTQRILWAEQEGSQLSQQLSGAFMNLEQVISDTVADVLGTFVSEGLRQQAIAEFVDALRTLLSGAPSRLIKVTGPEDILSMIENKLGPYAGAIEFVSNADAEVTTLSQDTTIETQLEAWSNRLGSILKVDC